jgi:MarR family transcriptional regulator, lower aerobic nicotinate degradation pathway regulator
MAERSEASGAAGPERGTLPPSMRDRVPFLLYRAAELSHQMANAMLARIQLTARQVGILTLVTEWEPMTQKALGDMLRIDRTTMVSLIDDLERKGYVVRRRHPRDRRAFLVQPTPSGCAAKVRAVAILDEQQSRFLAPLTSAEREQLGTLLKRLQRPPGPGAAAGDGAR